MKNEKFDLEDIVVTRENFHEQRQNIKNLIEKEGYKFVFFNAEYSNLSTNCDSYLDSIDERYSKIIEKLEKTKLINFEILLFKIKDSTFDKKVFKFPIIKRSKFTEEKNLTLHKSTMEYFYIFRNHFFNINVNKI